jgi:hypothetical protein
MRNLPDLLSLSLFVLAVGRSGPKGPLAACAFVEPLNLRLVQIEDDWASSLRKREHADEQRGAAAHGSLRLGGFAEGG